MQAGTSQFETRKLMRLIALVCIVLALFLSCVLAQTQVNRIKIDDYTEGTNNVVIKLTSNLTTSQTPVTKSSIFTSTNGAGDANILGGERDLQYTALSGLDGRSYNTYVVLDGYGQWVISTPQGATGSALMQYDSLDNSITLNVKGFTQITGTSAGLDLTEGGLGKAFLVTIETDLATSFAINVYSPNGNKCTTSIPVTITGTTNSLVTKFSAFTGSCDFTNVGAIEINVQTLANVDTVLTLFTTQGDPNPTTPTPSKSVVPPSPSPSASKGAPVSNTPSSSPAAAAQDCFCSCPAFTCELIFDVDDDNNHALFFVDDDGFGNSKGYFGGYGYYYANGVGQSGSATTLVASFAAILAAFLGFF